MRKVWNTGVIVCFDTVKSQGDDENLRQNISFPKNGRLSRLSDLALIPGRKAVDEGIDTGPRTSRGLRFL